MVKNLPTKQEMQVRSLGQEDPLEEEMVTWPSILVGKSRGQRSLVGSSAGVRLELATKQKQNNYDN